ncbi:MAG: signal peptide peptidase SppA [Methanophagales archaeon ANME-1-THS]|nr:MAG: signal peptide peptidase SppA [Methanophagales archaeon ANME-1-THS]
MEKRTKILIAAILIAVLLGGAGYGYFFVYNERWRIPGNKIAIIELEGEITGDTEGGTHPETVRKLLIRAEEDRGVQAVVLRINSGGGTAGASWEIYQAVKRVEKPVVVSIGDIGASGAYLVAVAADEIVATPMSMIGSIGAALEFPFDIPVNESKEAEEFSALTSGEFKDVFTDYRLNESERRYLGERLAIVLEVFLQCVTEQRNISEENMTILAKGGWYTGEEGLRMGLVDKLGNLDDAIEEAAIRAHISLEDTRVVSLRLEDSKVIEEAYSVR